MSWNVFTVSRKQRLQMSQSFLMEMRPCVGVINIYIYI